jgi:hypothetical protein
MFQYQEDVLVIFFKEKSVLILLYLKKAQLCNERHDCVKFDLWVLEQKTRESFY